MSVLRAPLRNLNFFKGVRLIVPSINVSSRRLMSQWESGSMNAAGGKRRASPLPPLPIRKSLPVNTIIKFVPQQEAWIVERFGKFHRILEPGLRFLVPLVDQIKYVQSLKEITIDIPSQSAITEDNVSLEIDGVLYIKVVDPYKASYGVENFQYAVTQLAQTTMRAEIGQMTLDRTLAERAQLNANIVDAITSASSDWGIKCLRYEIRDIHPPERVIDAMHSQVSAERQKRAEILASEGQRQAAINVAQGQKEATVLAAEAQKSEQILRAAGEAEAILLKAKANADGIAMLAKAIEQNAKGKDAVSLKIAEKYMDAFHELARESTTMLLPSKMGDPASMVAQAMAIYTGINEKASGDAKQVKFPIEGDK